MTELKKRQPVLGLRVWGLLMAGWLGLDGGLLAQVYPVSGPDVIACSGLFVDDGPIGDPNGGPYSNNDYSITICPETPGAAIAAEFLAFSLQTNANPNNSDVLLIYDGNSTAAPLIGQGTGNNFQGVTATASLNNPTGCLTFQFFCNNGATAGATGWAIELSCVTPCSYPESALALVSPPAFPDNPGSVGVCPMEEVTFSGAGSQPDASPLVAWVWNWGDGSVENTSSPTASHAYAEPGEYLVTLVVQDGNGCNSSNLVPFQVLVSTLPQFNTLFESPICTNQATAIDGSAVQSVTWTALPPLSVSEEQNLPDNSNVPFTSDLAVDFFDEGQTVTSCDDLLGLSAIMEHTFIGDLTIWVECPNGQEMLLLDNGPSGGPDATGCMFPDLAGNNLGDPVNGIGYTYNWSMDADYIIDDPSNPATANGAGVPGGDYLPCGDFCELLGCPLNGIWTLNIHDQWLGDDGYLFEWAIEFNPVIVPGVTTFTPTIGLEADSSYWDLSLGDYGVLGVDPDADVVDLIFDAAGTYEFDYVVTNNFGCTWDTTIQIEVLAPPAITAGSDFFACEEVQLAGSLTGVPPAVCSEDAGSYTLCYGDFANFQQTLCPDEIGDGSTFMSVTFQAGQVENFFDPFYIYDGPNTSSPVLAGPIAGNLAGLSFTASNASGCLTLALTSDGSVSCGGGFYPEWQYTVGCTNGGGVDWNWSPAENLIGANFPTPLVTNLTGPTLFTLDAEWSFLPGCASTDAVLVTPAFEAEIANTADPSCFGNDGMLEVAINPSGSTGPWTLQASLNGVPVATQYNVTSAGTSFTGLSGGDYLVTVSDGNCTVELEASLTPPVIPILSVSQDTTICIDGTATLTPVLNPPASNVVYHWSTGSTSTGAWSVGPNSPTLYTVYAVYSIGCETAEEEVFVDILDPLQVTFSVGSVICEGDSAWVAVQETLGGLAPYNYAWTNGVSGVGAWVTPTVSTTYCATISDACETPTTGGCVEVTVPEPLDASFAADSLGGCYPFTVEFAGNESSLQSIAEAQWTFGDGGTSGSLGSSFHTYIEEGVWTVSLTLTSVEGCVYSETAPQFITTVRPPEARFSADPVIQTLPETRFEFNNYSVFASGQTWNFAGLGESEAWEPVFVFPQDQSGDYPVTLVVWNEWGCKDSLRQIVRVNEQFTMFIPTGFTPDQDGLNDAWTFYGIDVDETDFHLVVFDRWGSIVFETRDLNDAWVGDFQGGSHYAENGVYAYQVITRSLSTGERKWLTGSVTLTR
ncbi:MAG: hypothetical protein RJA19_1315 [Bacteroidota bacterium]